MRTLLKILIAFLLFLFSLIQDLIGQEIDCNVTVNMDQLDFESRRFVSTLERDFEDYINNRRWLESGWEGPKIPVEMSIVLSGGANQIYGVRMLVISKRYIDGPDQGSSVNLKLYEDQWSFEYMQNASLTNNPLRFDPISSVIDYYMYLVIGFDLETYEELGGEKPFDEARKIVNMGASYNAAGFETYSQPGEFTKYNLMAEIQNPRYYPIRKTWFAYYFDALDLMAFEPEKGRKGMVDVLDKLVMFKKNKLAGPSVLMQLFFDTKAQELASFFKGYEDENDMVWEKLIYLDPGNATLYRESAEK